jgi:hypothetical protein
MRRRNQEFIQLQTAWRNGLSTLQLDPELEFVGELLRVGASERVIVKLAPEVKPNVLRSLRMKLPASKPFVFLGSEL